MPDSVAEERQEDEDRVLSPPGETVFDFVLGLDAFHESFLFHLVQPAGKYARREPGVVPENLTEPVHSEECHVAEDQQGPLAAESLHTLPDRIRLVGEQWINPALDWRRFPPLLRYPSSP